MRFGEKVRDLRKKHSLTQDELAKCLGVSKRTVIGWERDGRYPRNVEIFVLLLISHGGKYRVYKPFLPHHPNTYRIYLR